MANRSGIRIKPGHEGRLTRKARSRHLSLQQFEAKVRGNPGDYSTATRRQVTFAENARHWHHGR
jgi:hypothetical protein